MGSEIEKAPVRIPAVLVDPASGEEVVMTPAAILAIMDPMDFLAWLDRADGDDVAPLLRTQMDYEREQVRPLKDAMKERLLELLDKSGGVMTREMGGVKVVGTSRAAADGYRRVDEEKLQKALRRLIRAGYLEPAVTKEVFKREVKVSVSRPAVERLIKIGGEVGAAIDQCLVADPQTRDVKVTWS